LYLDDSLCIHHDAKKALYEIHKNNPKKNGSIRDLTITSDQSCGQWPAAMELEPGAQAPENMYKRQSWNLRRTLICKGVAPSFQRGLQHIGLLNLLGAGWIPRTYTCPW